MIRQPSAPRWPPIGSNSRSVGMTSVHHLGGGWPGDPRHWGIRQTRLHGRARILTSFCFGQSHKPDSAAAFGRQVNCWLGSHARMLLGCNPRSERNGFWKTGAAASWQPCRPRDTKTHRQVPSGRFSLGPGVETRQAALQRRSGIATILVIREREAAGHMRRDAIDRATNAAP